MECPSGKLYLLASPIGNLEDFSFRAKEVLVNCELIACEDTRITSRLLARYDLKKPLVSYREENEAKQAVVLANKIAEGINVGLLSDAGFPTISDPGFRLVRECRKHEIQVVPIPGPNAAVCALSASGLPTHNFLFLGFLPKKKNAVIKILEKWNDFDGSIIFYESRYKIERTLKLFLENLGPDRYVCLARELTKVHETILSGPLERVISQFRSGSPKGEFTLVLGPEGYSF